MPANPSASSCNHVLRNHLPQNRATSMLPFRDHIFPSDTPIRRQQMSSPSSPTSTSLPTDTPDASNIPDAPDAPDAPNAPDLPDAPLPSASAPQCFICGQPLLGDEDAVTQHVNSCLDRHEDEQSRQFAHQLQFGDENPAASAADAPPSDQQLGPAERIIQELEHNDAALAAALGASDDAPERILLAQPSLRGSLNDSAERVFLKVAPKLVSTYDAVDSFLMRKAHICSQIDLFSSNIAGHGWDCGFRNIQIMFSSLMYDDDYRKIIKRAGLKEVPSLMEIAAIIEEAWKKGYDPEGAANFNGQLMDKEVWIGATEVFCFFQNINVSVLVQDFETPNSKERAKMYEWIFSYFDKACGGKACSMHRWSFRGATKGKRRFVAPIFCQYQGHSLTIVGAERTKVGAIQILILDPSHSFFESFNTRERLRSEVIKRDLNHYQFQQPRFQMVYLAEMNGRASNRTQGSQ